MPGPVPLPLDERFANALDFDGPIPEFAPHLGPCWLWTLGTGRGGYGKIKVAGKTLAAHKVLWELIVGEVEGGLQLDHLCRVSACCNPDHLEPVTPSVNKLRTPNLTSWYAAHTHCKSGHEFNETNTRIDSRGYRHCRPCDVLAQRRCQARKKVLS